MIVRNIGYLKMESVLELEHFSIYETHKKTHVLVITNDNEECPFLYTPRKDRLPYKLVEDKKIYSCKKVFDSKKDSLTSIDTTKWNNRNQIMSYEEYTY